MVLLAFLVSYIWYVSLSSLFHCGMFHFCYDSLLARLVVVASLCMAFGFSVGDGVRYLQILSNISSKFIDLNETRSSITGYLNTAGAIAVLHHVVPRKGSSLLIWLSTVPPTSNFTTSYYCDT
jgi:hypothetical protein